MPTKRILGIYRTREYVIILLFTPSISAYIQTYTNTYVSMVYAVGNQNNTYEYIYIYIYVRCALVFLFCGSYNNCWIVQSGLRSNSTVLYYKRWLFSSDNAYQFDSNIYIYIWTGDLVWFVFMYIYVFVYVSYDRVYCIHCTDWPGLRCSVRCTKYV